MNVPVLGASVSTVLTVMARASLWKMGYDRHGVRTMKDRSERKETR